MPDEPTSPVTPTNIAAQKNAKFEDAVNENFGKINTRLEKVEKMEGRLKTLEAAKTVPAKTDCSCAVA